MVNNLTINYVFIFVKNNIQILLKNHLIIKTKNNNNSLYSYNIN